MARCRPGLTGSYAPALAGADRQLCPRHLAGLIRTDAPAGAGAYPVWTWLTGNYAPASGGADQPR